jgi:hypothetical protein
MDSQEGIFPTRCNKLNSSYIYIHSISNRRGNGIQIAIREKAEPCIVERKKRDLRIHKKSLTSKPKQKYTRDHASAAGSQRID